MACSLEIGPKIKTSATQISSIDFNKILMSINCSFSRYEYENAIRAALVAAINFQVLKFL